PGGVMVAMLGSKEGGAPGALVKLDNDGNFLEAHPAPDYMYDVGVKPELNLIVTSSWAHPHAVKAGNTPMDQVGDEVVAWDWKTAKVLQVEHLDKSPLEVRWLHGAAARGGFINCAFGNSVWHWQVGPDGKLTRCCRTRDRKSTRLNSSHEWISYAVFCLNKKNDTSEVT